MKKILFLHGFFATGSCPMARALKEAFEGTAVDVYKRQILYIAVDCMREMLLEGKKIRLGDLGDFSLLLTSKEMCIRDSFCATVSASGVNEKACLPSVFASLSARFATVSVSYTHLKGREWLEQIRLETMKDYDKVKARQRFRSPATAADASPKVR